MSGYKVEAADGEVGKVDEASLDADASYLVVDTGPWVLGKKAVIPAGLVERVDRDDEKVYVSVTKDEIKNAPEFERERFGEAEHRERLAAYYRPGSTQSGGARET
ncbi:MAG: PRC-barrel domain-containing protein [Actinomycetota bacterium]|nr:PRC-barrel domain-containing protein [Actinomycetota bacterium]